MAGLAKGDVLLVTRLDCVRDLHQLARRCIGIGARYGDDNP
jgi:hypothetical protein